MCSKEYQTYFQRKMKQKSFHLLVVAGLSFSDAASEMLHIVYMKLESEVGGSRES